MKTRDTHIPALDGVRGLAISMVLSFHLWQTYGEQTDLLQGNGILGFLSIGQKGVDLFFVLSGFLITGILLRTKKGPRYFMNFYTRRALRIFPLYYGVIILCLFWGTYGGAAAYSLANIWPYFFYLQNIVRSFNLFPMGGPGHFWSLAVEEHFYLLWPLIVYLYSRKIIAMCCLFLIALSFLARLWMDSHQFSSFGFTVCRVDSLAIGALLNIIYSSKAWPSFCRIVRSLAPAFCIMAGILYFLLSGKSLVWVQSFKFVFFALLAAVLIILSLGPSRWNPVPRIMNQKQLCELGKISYGLYIFHPFVFYPVIGNFIPFLEKNTKMSDTFLIFVGAAVSLAGSIVVAVLSYKYFELPFLRLKNRFGGYQSELNKTLIK
jgi:hypothetical protein